MLDVVLVFDDVTDAVLEIDALASSKLSCHVSRVPLPILHKKIPQVTGCETFLNT